MIEWLLCLLQHFDQVFWKKVPYATAVKAVMQKVLTEIDMQGKLNAQSAESRNDIHAKAVTGKSSIASKEGNSRRSQSPILRSEDSRKVKATIALQF